MLVSASFCVASSGEADRLLDREPDLLRDRDRLEAGDPLRDLGDPLLADPGDLGDPGDAGDLGDPLLDLLARLAGEAGVSTSDITGKIKIDVDFKF